MKNAREFAIALAATDLGSNVIAIAEHDREIRAAALREAIKVVEESDGDPDFILVNLRRRLDRAERGE